MAKRKKNYLPKQVGQVKIPKRLRRGLIGAALSSAVGQAILAAVILKAGSAVGRSVERYSMRKLSAPDRPD